MRKIDTISALKLGFLPQLVEAFLAKSDKTGTLWTATRLGREALRDPGKIHLMRKGMQLRPASGMAILKVIEKAAPGFADEYVKQRATENFHDQ